MEEIEQEPNTTQTPTGNWVPKKTILGVLLLCVFLGGAAIYTRTTKEIVETINDTKVVINPFNSIEVTAKAAIVYDVLRGSVLYAKESERQLPLASLTKLMTALIAAETLSPDTKIAITPLSMLGEGDSGFLPGEEWNMRDLIDFTLLSSSNDGALALAGAASALAESGTPQTFVAKMNERARELGLTQTYFLNATGLDASENFSGTFGSAYDVALLLSYILASRADLLEGTRYNTHTFLSADNVAHTASNTNTALAAIPGFIGSKTGFTDLAGGNLAIAADSGLNHPLVIVVLGSTAEERFSDVERLYRTALVYLSQKHEEKGE